MNIVIVVLGKGFVTIRFEAESKKILRHMIRIFRNQNPPAGHWTKIIAGKPGIPYSRAYLMKARWTEARTLKERVEKLLSRT